MANMVEVRMGIQINNEIDYSNFINILDKNLNIVEELAKLYPEQYKEFKDELNNFDINKDNLNDFSSSPEVKFLALEFDTKWNVPVAFYKFLSKLGFDVYSEYCEACDPPSFVGTFDSKLKENLMTNISRETDLDNDYKKNMYLNLCDSFGYSSEDISEE
jgi:hypothetical protein